MSIGRHPGPPATPFEQDLAAAFLELQRLADRLAALHRRGLILLQTKQTRETESGGPTRPLPWLRNLP
jgi:hypothetical protein